VGTPHPGAGAAAGGRAAPSHTGASRPAPAGPRPTLAAAPRRRRGRSPRPTHIPIAARRRRRPPQPRRFGVPEDAALAADVAALLVDGRAARLNFPPAAARGALPRFAACTQLRTALLACAGAAAALGAAAPAAAVAAAWEAAAAAAAAALGGSPAASSSTTTPPGRGGQRAVESAYHPPTLRTRARAPPPAQAPPPARAPTRARARTHAPAPAAAPPAAGGMRKRTGGRKRREPHCVVYTRLPGTTDCYVDPRNGAIVPSRAGAPPASPPPPSPRAALPALGAGTCDSGSASDAACGGARAGSPRPSAPPPSRSPSPAPSGPPSALFRGASDTSAQTQAQGPPVELADAGAFSAALKARRSPVCELYLRWALEPGGGAPPPDDDGGDAGADEGGWAEDSLGAGARGDEGFGADAGFGGEGFAGVFQDDAEMLDCGLLIA
jgi:hypothetical protein